MAFTKGQAVNPETLANKNYGREFVVPCQQFRDFCRNIIVNGNRQQYAIPGIRGFTLIELLVVVAIIAVLVAMLLPALQAARERAQTIGCMANQRELGLAIRMYADEWNDFLPPSWDTASPTPANDFAACWFGKLYHYTKNHNIFSCPSASFLRVEGQMDHGYPVVPGFSSTQVAFGWNFWYLHFGGSSAKYYGQGYASAPMRVSDFAQPSATLALTDTDNKTVAGSPEFSMYVVAWAMPPGGPSLYYWPAFRHNHLSNVLMLDGHAAPMSKNDLATWEYFDLE